MGPEDTGEGPRPRPVRRPGPLCPVVCRLTTRSPGRHLQMKRTNVSVALRTRWEQHQRLPPALTERVPGLAREQFICLLTKSMSGSGGGREAAWGLAGVGCLLPGRAWSPCFRVTVRGVCRVILCGLFFVPLRAAAGPQWCPAVLYLAVSELERRASANFGCLLRYEGDSSVFCFLTVD